MAHLRYLLLSNNYLTLASISGAPSRHDDPAMQQGQRGSAEPAEQPCFGARCGGMAAEPLVMVARDQQTLVGERACHYSRDGPQAVAKGAIGIRRARVAEHAGAGAF